jgi:protein subunit release factor A
VHKPTGIRITSNESRSLETNRHYCIKKLKEKLDVLINGENSKKMVKLNKVRKQKDRRERRSKEKYQKDVKEG